MLGKLEVGTCCRMEKDDPELGSRDEEVHSFEKGTNKFMGIE